MTPGAHIAAAIEVLDQILAGENAEVSLIKWGRSNRFAGSADRNAIRDLVFDALRKKNSLYINDGTYGSLFDAGAPNFVLPSKMITGGRVQSKKLTAFSFFGPTCDGLDFMKGPFLLPNNIKEGDYIELGQLGAYSLTFRTDFNGFYSNEIHELSDKPILSMYDNTNDKVGSLVA